MQFFNRKLSGIDIEKDKKFEKLSNSFFSTFCGRGETCCFSKLSLRDKFNSEKKRVSNWPEMSKFRSFCRFWFNFCRFFKRFCSKFRNPLNNGKTSYAFFSWREHYSVVLHKHFRMTPKESKIFNFVFVQLVYFLNRFGVRMSANVHQRLNSYSIRLSGDYLQILVGKWLKSDRKKSKAWKFLSISDIFSEFLFDIGKFW